MNKLVRKIITKPIVETVEKALGVLNPQASKLQGNRNQRRAVRIKPSPIHSIHFHRREPSAKQVIAVANLSASGVGFIRGKDSWPEIDTSLQGDFEFRGKFYSVRLKVVHNEGEIIGCCLEGETQEFEELFQSHFSVEVAAARMSQVRSEMLAAEDSGKPHLFVGGDQCDLHFVVNQDSVTKFAMTFFGNHFEGGKGRPFSMGAEVGDSRFAGARIKSPSFVNGKVSPVERRQMLMQEGLRFLQNIEGLERRYREQIEEFIRGQH